MSNRMVELHERSKEGSDWSSDESTNAPDGYGATEMAENESLDLWKNNSPRRRALLRRIGRDGFQPILQLKKEDCS